MKRVIWAIVFIGLLALGYVNRTAIVATAEAIVSQSPCAVPRTYSIGEVDPRFKISKENFLAATQEAAGVWKNADEEPLFKYDPESKLTISLTYDERQFLNSQINDLNTQVDEQKDTLKPEIAEYETRASQFKQRNAALNNRISYWNDQGGAPEDEYNKLLQEQRSLQQEAKELQSMAETLNQSTDQYNTQIQELDQKVDAYNHTLEQKPEEGIYIREGRDERIIIYFNNSRQELIHTLAHEMGHALGMPHVDTTESIMYPKTTEVIDPSPEDITALAEVCRKRSIVETMGKNLSLLAGDIQDFATTTITKLQSTN